MKVPLLLIVIVFLHVLVVGSVLFIQGCGTGRHDMPDPPPAPVMPPQQGVDRPAVAPARPIVTPPSPERDIPRPTVDIKTYTVQPGDILSRIANRVGVSVREISELNGIDDPNKIRVGQELVLPAYAQTEKISKPQASAPKPKADQAKVEPGAVYEVAAGDVLSRIAVRHGTTVAAIMELNNLKNSKIIVGQKLRMPAGAAAPAADRKPSQPKPETRKPAPRESSIFDTRELNLDIKEEQISTQKVERVDPPPTEDRSGGNLFGINDAYTYTVAEGDTLMQIAKDFVVDLQQLRKMNNLSASDEVKPGQEILIPPANL